MNDNQFIYEDLTPINYNGNQKLISDLEKIFENTSNILIDWQIRENSIRKLGQICLGNSGKTEIFVQFFNKEIIANLSFQLADLRSSVMKEACRIVSLIGKELRNLVEPGAAHLLSKNILFKIAGSSNRVIADSSSRCILNLIKYINTIKIINIICEQKSTKSNYVRTICSQCILYIVSCYKKNLIIKANQILKDTIRILISDPNGDVRSVIRRSFITYKKRFPEEGDIIYDTLEKNIQKQINEDERIYGNKIIINEENIEKNIQLSPIKKLKSLAKTTGKPKSHEIRFKLKEIDRNNLNVNYFENDINDNHSNFLNNERENMFKKNIFNNKNNPNEQLKEDNEMNSRNEANHLNKIQIFKSAKGKRHMGYYGFQNNNTSKINHKDILKKLNEKFLNYNENNENNNICINEKRDKSIDKSNILPPIKQFNPTIINKSQNINKSSRSVLQKNKISLNNENDNGNENNKMNNNYIPVIRDMKKIKINNEVDNSLEKTILSKINEISIDNNNDEKIEVFQYFFNDFKNILNNYNNFSNNTLRQFINIHIDNLKENNDISLNEQIMKNFIRIFFYMKQILNNNDIQMLVKILIIKINMKEKTIPNLSFKLLDLIRKKGNIDDIYIGIINSCEENNLQIKEICYDYLSFLVNHYGNDNYFEKIFNLINNADTNSKKIGKLINALYKNNSEEFNRLYKEQNSYNQNKIKTFMDNNNLNFSVEFKDQIKLNQVNNFDNSIHNKIQKLITESKNSNNEKNYNISEEFKIFLETGNIKKFISFIENNINYLSSFIVILETYPENKYIKNYLNFIYSLISNSNKFNKEISLYMKLLLKQIINILISNINDSIYVKLIKEIFYMLPIKTNSQIYFREISKYLNDKSDILLLQILLGSIKNYIVYNKSNNLERQIQFFINELLSLLEHQSSDVRKIAIYCCVEMYIILKDEFNIYFEKIPKNTQNIINQLVKKKYG